MSSSLEDPSDSFPLGEDGAGDTEDIEDPEEIDELVEKSPSEKFHIEVGHKLTPLVCMSIGLECEINYNEKPWNTVGKQNSKPKVQEYKKEVNRRVKLFPMTRIALGDRPRSTNNWNKEQCVEWLKKYPLTGDCAAYVMAQTEHLKKVYNRHIEEAAEPWRAPVPQLRMFHCIVDDSIKAKFLRRNDAPTRRQLDSRNSDTRALTVWEEIANMWNDKDFNPVADTIDSHPDFYEAIDISYEAVAKFMPATATKVEDLMTRFRSMLVRVIKNWEASGQGEGGVPREIGGDDTIPVLDTDDVGFGSLQGRAPHALANRRNFLDGAPPLILYMWELFDKHQLLSTTCQILEGGLPDANSFVSLGNSARKRDRSRSVDNTELARSLFAMAEAQQRATEVTAQLAARAEENREWQVRYSRLGKQEDEIQRCIISTRTELRKAIALKKESAQHLQQELLKGFEADLAEVHAKMEEMNQQKKGRYRDI
jgi:hypothetical protein